MCRAVSEGLYAHTCFFVSSEELSISISVSNSQIQENVVSPHVIITLCLMMNQTQHVRC